MYIFTFVRITKFGLPKSKGEKFINAFSHFCLTLYITFQVRCTLTWQLLKCMFSLDWTCIVNLLITVIVLITNEDNYYWLLKSIKCLISRFSEEKPCRNLIVSYSGFEGEERSKVKKMIEATGAKLTSYFSSHNNILVCRRWIMPLT